MTGVCLSDIDYQKDALSKEYWEKLGQLMMFLQFLNTATERLAGSRFPTLEKSLPNFPSLGKMERDVLAIPATSVPSELAFSMGGLLCRDERASPNGKTIEMLMCMQDWYKQLPRVVM